MQKTYSVFYISNTSLCDKIQNMKTIVVIFGSHDKL